ncbi:cytochrome c biogenesis protein CcsA [Undibacterium sp. LX40W]|uniref:Cytochrome c biogenesis protein CcsA n=1 Tax=Undibacterium nitidum TaxID=2762298 RepID=A0A923HKI8_9BURK|nr:MULTISPECIES: cytochrome c biogenesis protein CcsA [Undibacterium]MBC3881335.1 cytochrome c biogenesis protein CcsA [Undibacterium nitidum]MBC3891882.1 cytochrome c biogenesis protein CcsA [Undibacterium sp. LX40W]
MLTQISLIAALLYAICTFIPSKRKWTALCVAAFAWALHGLALGMNIYADAALRVGFATMWSAAIWVSVLVFLVENRNFSLDGLRFLVLPQAALTVVLPLFFPGSLISLLGKTAMFPWHVGIALLAYSTLSIAAFHALVMYVQDRHLHKMRGRSVQTWLEKAIDQLPALLKMEQLLFILVSIGFILLSLTVLSGVVFSEQVLGVAFKLDHKTVLSLFSWVLFATLLIGRQWKGWRGKAVLRMTLFGFLFLLLAYVGSRFVLEVLLHRSVM